MNNHRRAELWQRWNWEQSQIRSLHAAQDRIVASVGTVLHPEVFAIDYVLQPLINQAARTYQAFRAAPGIGHACTCKKCSKAA